MFYDLSVSGAGWGDSVYLVRAPYQYNPYSVRLMTSRVFCAVVMTMTMSTCFCHGQRGVGLLRRPGQGRHVLRLVCAWSWLGRQCVPVPRAVQSVRLQLPRHLVCAWPTLHVGSLDSPSSCTSLLAVNPLIHRLKQDTTKQIWFADNATAGGKLNNLREWWDCLTNIGPEYGYFPNDQKHGLF